MDRVELRFRAAAYGARARPKQGIRARPRALRTSSGEDFCMYSASVQTEPEGRTLEEALAINVA